MKVLGLNRSIFMFLGICLIDDHTNHRKKSLHILFGWLAVFISGSVIVSCSVCAINNSTTDVNSALYAACPAIANLRVFVTLISMIVFRQKITSFFENLQTFYSESNLITRKTLLIDDKYCCFLSLLDESAKSRVFFKKANELSNKISTLLLFYFPVIFGIEIVIISAISLGYCYMTKGLIEADNLFVPFNVA